MLTSLCITYRRNVFIDTLHKDDYIRLLWQHTIIWGNVIAYTISGIQFSIEEKRIERELGEKNSQ